MPTSQIPFTERDIVVIMRDLAAALNFLHTLSSPILYRNISVILNVIMKADSIYIGSNEEYKLGRLCSACCLPNRSLDKEELKNFLREYKYWNKESNIPPELHKGKVTLSSDIWLLGKLLKQLIDIPSELKIKKEYSPQLIALQKLMLDQDLLKRPTAEYIVKYIANKETLLDYEFASCNSNVKAPAKPIKSPGLFDNLTDGFMGFINSNSTK